MIFSAVKVMVPAILAFIIGILMTPALTGFMYRMKMWKTSSRSNMNTDAMSPDFKRIHNEKGETSTPRVGGVLIWLSVLVVTTILSLISLIFPSEATIKMNFLSKNQTLLPLATLLFASLIGLIDDFLQIYGKKLDMSDGLSRKLRILVVLLIAAAGAWWFFFKLNTLSILIPFYGEFELGIYFIPFFMAIVVGIFSGSIIDGIDGLAAGVMSSAFSAYMIIAFSRNQIDLAAFCAVIVGGLLAFLWFNIPPARFYLGETGMLGLTITLAVVAFLTKEVAVLPIIAFPLVVTSFSSSIQMFSKRHFGKKIFRVAPLHHHFEAIGWPSYKVTMRYWIISIICAIFGTVIALLGRTLS